MRAWTSPAWCFRSLMATPVAVPRFGRLRYRQADSVASTGEGLKDFEVFHPDRMASRILDMGDILTLIEQAQKQFDEEEARKAAIKISDGSFGLDDFLDQLQQVRKLGPMKNLLGMIPGMAAHRKELEQFDEREIDRTEAIIRSMTPAERRDPSIIDGSLELVSLTVPA